MGAIDTYPPQNVSAQTPVLAFASSTTTQSGVSTEQDVTGCVVSVTVPAGRRIRITGRIEVGTPSVNNNVFLLIREVTAGNAEVGRGAVVLNTSTESTLTAIATLTPTTGFHTYKLTLQTNTGTVNTTNISSAPNYILVEDITGSQLPVLPQSVPVGQLAFAQASTTNQTFTTAVAVTGCTVNIAVPAGRTIRVTGQIQYSPGTAANEVSLRIKEDGNIVKLVQETGDTVGRAYDVQISHILSPTAGAHTYNLEVERTIGAATDTILNSSARAAYILVEDISPTPAPGQGAPSSTLGYSQVTSPQTGITTVVDLTNLTTTVTVPEGRRLRITGYVPQYSRTAGTVTFADLRIFEGATELNRTTAGMNNTYHGAYASVVVTPTAGMHTYKLRATSDGTVTMEANALFPAFILVEDITGAVWPVGSTVTSGLIASEPFMPFIPSVTQGVAVTSTVTTARYIKMGRLVTCYARVNITSAGTGGSVVLVSLPVPGFAHGGNGVAVGSGFIYDASTNTIYECVTNIQSNGLTVDFVTDVVGSNAWGGTPNLALASGDIINMCATYEAAS